MYEYDVYICALCNIHTNMEDAKLYTKGQQKQYTSVRVYFTQIYQ